MRALGTFLQVPAVLKASVPVAIWTTGSASIIAFGCGAIKNNDWKDGHYGRSSQIFKYSAFASLNESVQAAVAASNHLLIEAPRAISKSPAP